MNIRYATPELISSFYQALSFVARERIYIERVEPPPFEKVRAFQMSLIGVSGPVYYALAPTGGATGAEQVVGWCDIFPLDNPRMAHRGNLGMGLLPPYRRQGIGSLLLERALSHAKAFGLEKVELQVYSSNAAAIALYKKFGFKQEGVIEHYRKLDGVYFDAVVMGRKC